MQGVDSEVLSLTRGTVLNGRYEIVKTIGFGGFSIIYEGYDHLLRSRVALKEYFPHYIAERDPYRGSVITRNNENAGRFSDGLKRFKEEAHRMVRLKGLHNTVNVFGLFEEKDTCYIVMELLEGTTLLGYLRTIPDERFADIEDAKQIIFSVAEALEYIHANKLLHRDVSPDNIFLCSDGRVKLIDLGAARNISENGELSVVVKSGCTPPEQYRKRGKQGSWTDLYALGATFYRMLTGVFPDAAPDRMDAREEFPPPSAVNPAVPDYLDAMILRCLAYEPALRISTAAEIKSILEKERKVDSVQVTRRRRSVITAAAYGLCLLCAALFVTISFVLLGRSETLYTATIRPCGITVERPAGMTSDAGWQALLEDFQTVCPQIDVTLSTEIENYDVCVFDDHAGPYAELGEVRELNKAAEDYYITIAYDGEIIYWNTMKSYENGLDMNGILASGVIPPEHLAESLEVFLAPDNPFCAYMGSVSHFQTIQRELAGMYRILPVPAPLRPIRYAVQGGLSENQQTAAMRFLLYLSSARGQEILFIHNEGVIPAEESQFSRFFETNSELAFLKPESTAHTST